jgi:hypothetical protein
MLKDVGMMAKKSAIGDQLDFEGFAIKDIHDLIKVWMKERFAEDMEIEILTDRSDLICIGIDLLKSHKRMAFLIGAERAIQIACICDLKIDPLHRSILAHLTYFLRMGRL